MSFLCSRCHKVGATIACRCFRRGGTSLPIWHRLREETIPPSETLLRYGCRLLHVKFKELAGSVIPIRVCEEYRRLGAPTMPRRRPGRIRNRPDLTIERPVTSRQRPQREHLAALLRPNGDVAERNYYIFGATFFQLTSTSIYSALIPRSILSIAKINVGVPANCVM